MSRSPFNVIKIHSGLILILSLGTGLLSLHVNHALESDLDLLPFLLGTLIPMGFAVSLLIGGVWLWRQNLDPGDVLRVGIGCTAGAIVFTTGAILIIIYQQTRGVTMADPSFIIASTASGGAVVGFVISIYNNRLRRAQAEANQLSRQITVLNRVLRHDIRTKANLIQGHAELLTNDSTDIATQAHKIKQQTGDVVKIGNQAKNIERILHDSGEELEVVDITSLVEEACDGVYRDYPTAEINISLPETQQVFAHPLVDSALSNVIENAVEHNDKQTPCVNIDSEIVSDGGTERVELRIADNGPGIPETEIDVLENGYETDLNHSSGLGLWLVNWVITNVDGDIQFERNQPEGSVVCLQLKRAEKSIHSPTIRNGGGIVGQSSIW